ncbi:hypothetical protein MJO29_006048 [Puccinia striiformis f. sp. tritici]|nr:hypothetical protein Pst134EB_012238 [Puccinia striiformis f. sp. tritici]KAI7957831.1 hypothetical protein MJO29_006048 [Puccinia striiformis f. sp. tritici]KAI9604872.1 hypothetical protein H4Q26_002842 [Puccinia striiformis f. sp. tritici PST-130]
MKFSFYLAFLLSATTLVVGLPVGADYDPDWVLEAEPNKDSQLRLPGRAVNENLWCYNDAGEWCVVSMANKKVRFTVITGDANTQKTFTLLPHDQTIVRIIPVSQQLRMYIHL